MDMLNQKMSLLRRGEPHDVDIHVGGRLRLRRSALGLSQDQVGTAVGLSFQQIQKYERGVNRMGASRLYEIGKVLHVPISYFFEDFGELSLAEEGDSSYQPDPAMKRETLELMRAYHQVLDLKQRKKILKLVQALAEEAQLESEEKERNLKSKRR